MAVGVLSVSLLAGCGASDDQRASGLVVDIETLGLGRVQGFTLRTDAGELLEFTIDRGTQMTDGAWPPEHLQEHRATASGVAVVYRQQEGRRVVVRLDDAPWVGGGG